MKFLDSYLYRFQSSLRRNGNLHTLVQLDLFQRVICIGLTWHWIQKSYNHFDHCNLRCIFRVLLHICLLVLCLEHHPPCLWIHLDILLKECYHFKNVVLDYELIIPWIYIRYSYIELLCLTCSTDSILPAYFTRSTITTFGTISRFSFNTAIWLAFPVYLTEM